MVSSQVETEFFLGPFHPIDRIKSLVLCHNIIFHLR